MTFIKIVLGSATILGIVGAIGGGKNEKMPCTLLFVAGAVLYLVCLKMGG